MSYLSGLSCCAVDELVDLEDHLQPLDVMMSLCDNRYGNYRRVQENETGAFIIFTDLVKNNLGDKFHKFILKNKLGQVTKVVGRKNSNTGNWINVWVWAINKSALRKWWRQNRNYEENADYF